MTDKIFDDSKISGKIVRLEPRRGFGYVESNNESNRYIFIAGKALSHKDFRRLTQGCAVQFHTHGQGQVTKLSLSGQI